MIFDERITLLHEILATTNFGEFQKFAKISCRQNLLPPKLIDAKINYMAPNVYLMYRTNIVIGIYKFIFIFELLFPLNYIHSFLKLGISKIVMLRI